MEEALFSKLRDDYRARLPSKIRAIRARLSEIAAGDPNALEALRGMAHALRGSGGSYGFPAISEAAKAVELGRPSDVPRFAKTLILTLEAALHAVSNGDTSSD